MKRKHSLTTLAEFVRQIKRASKTPLELEMSEDLLTVIGELQEAQKQRKPANNGIQASLSF